jgi:predicted transposase
MNLAFLDKLQPTPEQSAALLQTMERFNAACNQVAEAAFREHSANKIRLQKLVYYDIREQFGLPAQMAIRVISKTAEAYKRAKPKKPTFIPHGAMSTSSGCCPGGALTACPS